MKIWHLENEYDAFIAAVSSGEGGAEGGCQGRAWTRIKAEVLARGEAALVACGRQFDGWTADYPLKISRDELEAAASRVRQGRPARAQGR